MELTTSCLQKHVLEAVSRAVMSGTSIHIRALDSFRTAACAMIDTGSRNVYVTRNFLSYAAVVAVMLKGLCTAAANVAAAYASDAFCFLMEPQPFTMHVLCDFIAPRARRARALTRQQTNRM